MGFSTIGSFVIMFFGIIILVSSAMLIYNSLIDSTNTATDVQKQKMDNMINTRINIDNVTFDSAKNPDITSVYISNVGTKKLELAYIDIYIDGIKIPRSTSNRTIEFYNGTNIANPLHWDPGEKLCINITLDRGVGPHTATVTTQHGVTDTRGFIVT